MHFQAPGRKPRRKNRFLSPLLLWPQKKWENVERQSAISIANLAMLREFCKGSRAVYSKFILSSLNMMEWNGEALITSLKDQSLRKIKFNKSKFIKEEIIFKGSIGRIRDIKIHESGDLYLLSDKGELWRMYK